MKKVILLSALTAIFFLHGCTSLIEDQSPTANEQATPETVNLFVNMKALTGKGFMIGHQDALAYGIGWEAPVGGPSDIYLLVNDYPAVFGWDLGHIEHGAEHNLDGVPFASMKQWAKQVHAMGGINTYSWHADNPLTGSHTWDVSNPGTVKSVLPFGEKHDQYLRWLDKLAVFFLDLNDEQGNPIPVIFRPYHEHTGSWFWWGQDLCTAADYKELWFMTFHYLKDTKKVNNLLWAYSPSDNFESIDDFTERYPGKDYVDIVGFDMYQQPGQTSEDFAARLKNKATLLVQFAATLEKIPAVTELGYERIPDPVWWTQVVYASLNDLPVSYVLFWRNAINRPDHFFAPFPGHISQDDFKKFYEMPKTLFLNDIKPENLYIRNSTKK